MRSEYIVLGIETSCDETSCAVVADGTTIISNIVSSQIDIHRRYGGVVPEIASRKHVEAITPVIDSALDEANMSLDDIHGVAVTCGPGLVGGLLVGVCAAKCIALSRQIPLIGVHHIEGHLYANFLEHKKIGFPVLCLTVSGGHTDVIYMSGHGQYQRIGGTTDDAAGEAFDKVARLLGLRYPGGPEIDRLALEGDRSKIQFPRALQGQTGFDLSFSGIKTAVKNYVQDVDRNGNDISTADIAASFQEAVVDMLADVTIRAAKETGVRSLLLSGGVAANSRLRQVMRDKAEELDMILYYPSLGLCTDNAAMIASAGYFGLVRGKRSNLGLGAYASLPLESVAP
jgi:N6-L-threonylcarbamoyladenine synthase